MKPIKFLKERWEWWLLPIIILLICIAAIVVIGSMADPSFLDMGMRGYL